MSGESWVRMGMAQPPVGVLEGQLGTLMIGFDANLAPKPTVVMPGIRLVPEGFVCFSISNIPSMQIFVLAADDIVRS